MTKTISGEEDYCLCEGMTHWQMVQEDRKGIGHSVPTFERPNFIAL